MNTINPSFKEKLIDFVFYCRERQFKVSSQQIHEAFQVAQKGHCLDRTLFKYSLKAICCTSPNHAARFDEMFDIFWSRKFQNRLDKKLVKVKPKVIKRGAASLIWLGNNGTPKEEKQNEAKETKGASNISRLKRTDFSKIEVTDKQTLNKLAEELFHQVSLRIKRRFIHANKGQIHIKKTIRKGLSKGGMLLDLAYIKKKKEKRKLVFLLDVSGSMDTYSFYLLKFIIILKKYFRDLEFFTFSTYLTQVTPYLKSSSEEEILKMIGTHVREWSNGTKIGQSLSQFVDIHGGQLLTQRHIVIIFSDGLETGAVGPLRDAVKAIKLRSKALIWLNPLKGMRDYQPIQKGIVNVMPHLDVFDSAHNLESLLKIEKMLMNV